MKNDYLSALAALDPGTLYSLHDLSPSCWAVENPDNGVTDLLWQAEDGWRVVRDVDNILLVDPSDLDTWAPLALGPLPAPELARAALED